MRYALLSPDLQTVQRYPLTRSMITKSGKVGDLAVMISSKTDITGISPRIVEVLQTEKPEKSEAYIVKEGTPVKVGNDWTQVWDQVALDAGEQTARLNSLKRATFEKVLEIGKSLRTGTYSVGPGEFDLSGDGFSRLILMGVVPGPRTVAIGENKQGIMQYFSATANQVANLVQDVSDFIDAIAANESALKDAIAAATNYSELQAIDINSGWPDPSPQ